MKPDDYRRLVALGLTPDQIAGVMEIMERDDEDRKAKGRARWRKHQENKKNANVSQHEQTLANVPHASATRGEDKTSTQKIEPQESKKEQSAQARLEGVLDPEHAKAVIDHRQRLRKPLTAYAARLLADKLASFPDPNGAVDRMIERGWQTVYPDEPKPQSRGSPAKPPSQAEVFTLISERAKNGQDSEDRGGVRQAISYLPAVRSG